MMRAITEAEANRTGPVYHDGGSGLGLHGHWTDSLSWMKGGKGHG